MSENLRDISVSVIVPIYNVELFLEEAIQSILNQSLQDFEIILINDGSTDDSASICQRFVQQDARIVYFKQANAGVSVARNHGLSLAKGEYVFFMDSDDTLDNYFLAGALQRAKEKSSDLVAIGAHYCCRSDHIMALPTCAMLIKKSFLDQYEEIQFPEGIQPCEDGLFSHQILALTNHVALFPEGIYHYRQHENQNHRKINNTSAKVLLQIPQWFYILEEFYSKHNLFQSHAFHLAKFMEHEPFEFRYIKMKLNNEQRNVLFKMIHDFMDKFVLKNISHTQMGNLTPLFLYFLSSKTHNEFDVFFDQYQNNKNRKLKIKLFFVKMIPISKWRRSVRKEITEKHNLL